MSQTLLAKFAVSFVAIAALGACQRTVESNLPTGPSAYAAIAVPQESIAPMFATLQPGDRIDVSVLREPDFSALNVMVDRTGNIYLPGVGEMSVLGLDQAGVARKLTDELGRRYLRNPVVSVQIRELALQTVSVEGEVEQPGVFEMKPGYTLLSAIAMARSPSDKAKLNEVFIFRQINGQRAGARFDLAAIRAGAAADPVILPGDVVVVGYSKARAIWTDVLTAAPLFNVFTNF